MKEIKTKPVTKDIKTLNKTAYVSRMMKNAYIRTKNQTVLRELNDGCNYVDDAGNSIQESTETVFKKAGHVVESYSKKVFGKVKEHCTLDADTPHPYTYNREQKTQKTPTSEVKKIVYGDTAQTETKLATEQSIASFKTKGEAKQTLHTSGKTEHTMKRSAGTGGKAVKESVKGMIKKTKKSVKTAEYTSKATIKTSQLVVKTTAKTVQITQRVAQAARTAARVVAITTKTAVKAIAVTIKAIIATVNGLTALIAAGGWIAIVVILVLCLAGFLLSSGFGIFFSNESSGEKTPIMTEVVTQLNEEFAAVIERIQDENPHDALELSGNGSSTISNWHEILAVYAVKAAADPENGTEVATLDDAKVGILQDVFWDMNKINHCVETIEYKEIVTTTDKDGNQIEETVTIAETVLHINVTSKSYSNMIVEYGFNVEQVKMLNELMQHKYQQLFMRLICN